MKLLVVVTPPSIYHNATKALAHVLEKKGMHIKGCDVAKDKSHITRYQELQHYKQTRKGVILDYS